MLIQLLKTFDLECKAMQTQLLNQKIDEQFGKEPFFNEAIKKTINKLEIKLSNG